MLLCRCLKDLNKLMMPRLMPGAPPRLDYEAAPYYNRTADEIGNYYFLHRCAAASPTHAICFNYRRYQVRSMAQGLAARILHMVESTRAWSLLLSNACRYILE